MAPLTALVPLDGSPFSRQILPVIAATLNPARYRLVALQVAKVPAAPQPTPPDPRSGAIDDVVTLLADRQPPGEQHPIYLDQLTESHRAEVLAELNSQLTALREAGFTVEAAVRYGEPAQEIGNYAKEIGADLLCLATHGRSGLSRLLMGSIAEQLVRKLELPIMLLRPVDL